MFYLLTMPDGDKLISENMNKLRSIMKQEMNSYYERDPVGLVDDVESPYYGEQIFDDPVWGEDFNYSCDLDSETWTHPNGDVWTIENVQHV